MSGRLKKPWFILWIGLCLMARPSAAQQGRQGTTGKVPPKNQAQVKVPSLDTVKQKVPLLAPLAKTAKGKTTPIRPTVKNATTGKVISKPSALKKKTAKAPLPPTRKDTVTLRPVLADSTLELRDTGRKDSVKVSNDLAGPVTYTADDSIVFSPKTKIARLYGSADVSYTDINLKAEQIQINYETSIVDANGMPDSTGKLAGTPKFKQGDDDYQADNMRYNFKTRKGLIKQVITKQGDGYLHGQSVKRESETSLYVKNAEFTTCNLEHPHFYIKSYKMKMIPGQKLISGPFLLHVADVPTPLGFIFGFFPIPKFKSSGIIIPTYGESTDLGFFLRNGGFYFALSDYFDLKMLGEIYTLGGWGLTPQSTYRKRYKYDGNINLRYNSRSILAPDGSGRRIDGYTKEFWVNWTHTPQARGNSRFSANVSAGTSQSQQLYNFSQNALFSASYTSSVAYSTSFPGTPFSLSVSARTNQNVRTKQFDADLPTVALTMNRIYPFKKRGVTKSNLITNLNVAYSLNSQYTLSNSRSTQSVSLPYGVRNLTPQLQQDPTAAAGTAIIPLSASTLPLLLKQGKTGIQHSVPIATTVRVLKYFNLTPAFQYRETWYASKLRYNYIEGRANKSGGQDTGITIDTVHGFNRFYDFNTSASLTTQIYGTFFIRKGNLEAIRHRLTPSIGFSYRPDFGTQAFGFFQRTQVNPINKQARTLDLNPYTNFLYGGPSTGGRQGAITFSLTNVVEAKLRKVSDSGKTTYTKKNLIENLTLGGSYNVIADSFNLSNINIGLNTRLFDKINIATSAVLDPYAVRNIHVEGSGVNRNMVRQKGYALANGQGLGRITSASFSTGFNFNPASGKTKSPLPRRNLSEVEERELSFIYANPNLFVDFNIPWTLNAQYNANYAYLASGDKSYQFSHYIRTNGDIKLSPKWKFGFDAPFDFQTKKFSSTSLNIYRDLHCWEMRMNVVVSGTRPQYNFDINVKASILQDLKLSKRNSFYDR